MKKILVNILCAFIPSESLRHRLRVLSSNKIFIIDNGKERRMKFFELKNEIKVKSIGGFRSNNVIKIDKSCKFIQLILTGDNNYISFGKNIYGYYIINGSNSKLIVNDGVHSNGTQFNLFGETEVIIGENCLFSWNVNIFPCDGHRIFDKNTGKPLSVKSKLVIGNHCWIAHGCIITKNGSLPDNTIVGAGSVVSKKFEKEYTVIAGNPAKVVKEGIRWER